MDWNGAGLGVKSIRNQSTIGHWCIIGYSVLRSLINTPRIHQYNNHFGTQGYSVSKHLQENYLFNYSGFHHFSVYCSEITDAVLSQHTGLSSLSWASQEGEGFILTRRFNLRSWLVARNGLQTITTWHADIDGISFRVINEKNNKGASSESKLWSEVPYQVKDEADQSDNLLISLNFAATVKELAIHMVWGGGADRS